MQLLTEAAELEKAAFETQNLQQRYKLFQEANSIRKIAKEISKWELFTKGY